MGRVPRVFVCEGDELRDDGLVPRVPVWLVRADWLDVLVPRVPAEEGEVVVLRAAVVAPRRIPDPREEVGVTGLRAAVVVPRRIPDPREEAGVVGRAIPEAPPRSVPLGRAWVAVRGAVTAPLRMIFGVVAGADRMVAPERIETPEDLAAAAVRAAW